MSDYLKIPSEAKVNVNWKVKQYDYSLEAKNNIITKLSEKLNIPKRHIRVTPIIVNNSSEEITITNEVISSIQKPDFQLKLFKHYLKENEIENYDFDIIKEIDAEINSKIDYKVYDNFCRYSINWIKWSNFLSYGENNFFDFRELKNLILLTGKPGNTSGKTTFAIELIHFLLFGKTNKAKTLANIFNNKCPQATEMYVEGSLTIEGEEYIIRRTLSRPDQKRRTAKSKVTQKVTYYKVIGDTVEELADVDLLMGENNAKTNQAIKKVIGDESDFDLIICATSKNLNDLVSKTEGERGKLFSKWIGLLPIQEKNDIAKKHFNELRTTFKSNLYNRVELENRNKTNDANIKVNNEYISKLEKENIELTKKAEEIQKYIKEHLEKKSKVDDTLLSIDIATLQANRKTAQTNIELINAQIQKGKEFIKELNFNEERNTSELNSDLIKFTEQQKELLTKQGELRATYSIHKKDLDEFKKNGKICPTCHRPYTDNEYNDYISKKNEEIKAIIDEGTKVKEELAKISKEIENISSYKEREKLYLQATIKIGSYEKKIDDNNKIIADANTTEEAYNKNKQAIDDNNKLDIEIQQLNSKNSDLTNTINQNIYTIAQTQNQVETWSNEISSNNTIINEIIREEKLIYNWGIYLDMVGKNGITKMVLRKTLPIINANLALLLNEVCDFTLEIQMNDKNEVVFNMIQDGVTSDLSTSGSGFEQTVASLALRAVLAKISTLPRLNFILLDEVWGAVSKENLPKIQNMMTKLLDDYDFILEISHIAELQEYHDKTIVVTKENGISKILLETK